MESSVNNDTDIDKKISVNRPLTCTQCDRLSNGENTEGTDTSCCLCQEGIVTSDLQENAYVKCDNVNSSENQSFENEQAEIVMNKNIDDPLEISIHTNDEENLKSNTTQHRNEEQIEASVKIHMKPTLDFIRIVLEKNRQIMSKIDELNQQYKSQSSGHLRQHEQIRKQIKISFIICVFALAFIYIFCTVTYMKVYQLQQDMGNDVSDLIKKNEDLQHQIGQLTQSQLDLSENSTKLDKLLLMTKDFQSEKTEHKIYLNKIPASGKILDFEQCRNKLESEIDCTQSVEKHVRGKYMMSTLL
jgi:cell division protein FtsL